MFDYFWGFLKHVDKQKASSTQVDIDEEISEIEVSQKSKFVELML